MSSTTETALVRQTDDNPFHLFITTVGGAITARILRIHPNPRLSSRLVVSEAVEDGSLVLDVREAECTYLTKPIGPPYKSSG